MDVAAFKLAGVVQRILSANILVKVHGAKLLCQLYFVCTLSWLCPLARVCPTNSAAFTPHLPLPPAQIVALVLVCAPIIWSLGCVYSMVTGSPIGISCYKIYTVLVRTPGEQEGVFSQRARCSAAQVHCGCLRLLS